MKKPKFAFKPGTHQPEVPEPEKIVEEPIANKFVAPAIVKPSIKPNSFKAPLSFRTILTIAVTNHPDYANTTDFLIDCFKRGLDEINREIDGIDEPEPEKNVSRFQTTKLSDNISKELNDYLNKNSASDIIKGTREASISCHLDMDFFLQLKSKVPLSKYRELRVFFISTICDGLHRLLIS